MKQELHRKVYTRLLISMIIVPAIPLLLAAAIGYWSYSSSTEAMVTQAIRQAAASHGDMVSSFLSERRNDLEGALRTMPASVFEGRDAQSELALMKSALGNQFVDVGLIDPQGIQMAYLGPYDLSARDYADTSWYREALRNGYYVSDVFLGFRNSPHFVVAVARRTKEGQWVLRATVDSSVFQRLVERVKVGDTGEAYIIDSQGVFQSVRRSGGGLLERDLFPYPDQQGDVMTFTGVDGDVRYLYASAAMNDGKWRLVVRQKRDAAFASVTSAGYALLLILVGGGALIVGLACFASRRTYDALSSQYGTLCQLETQLLRAARLAELGEMSAGFAHEINNPLQIMKSDLALMDLVMQDYLDKGEESSRAELTEIVAQLRIQIDRCAGITREILRFGRYGAPELQPIDLKEYLPNVGAMVEKKAMVHGIHMECTVQGGTPTVEADPGQLQQVMVNLLNNGIHAVVDRHGSEGGELTIFARPDGEGNAVIEVQDNGAGIGQENLERIFLPFFTTKAPGQGTGLGLSVCHNIIDSLGGRLEVTSERGRGTTFTISLPGLKD